MDDRIQGLIAGAMECEVMELVNDSHKHTGHAGDDGSGETHYTLMVVSDVFDGQSRVARQRLVLGALKEAFDHGLHAMSLRLFSLDEYQNRK